MLKSCFYTLAELEDPANLALWQQAFIDNVAPYANQHPAQTLVVMPAVPLRAEAGLSAAAAARARDWAQWLTGDFITLYTTRSNVSAFDLFDFWADAEAHSTNANALQRQYCRTDGDDHPNDAAYSAAADALTEFLTHSLGGDSWQNPDQPFDVNDDELVTANDPLLLINYINAHPESLALPAPPAAPPPYYDVNGDGWCTPLDVLMVINHLNLVSAAQAEGEAFATGRPDLRLAQFDNSAPVKGPWADTWPQYPRPSPLLGRAPNGRPMELMWPPAVPIGAATNRGGSSAREDLPCGRDLGPQESARETGLPEIEPILVDIAKDIRDAIAVNTKR